jgi:hypothetical protein
MESYAIGIILALLSCVFSNLGLLLQKLAIEKNLALPAAEQKVYHQLWRWWLGMYVHATKGYSALGVS